MSDYNYNWRELRQSKIKDYLIFSYIISLLLMGLFLIETLISYGFDLEPYSSYIFILFFLIIYGIIKYLKNITMLVKPLKINYLIFCFFTTFMSFIIYYNITFDKYFLKIFYFVPIILYTVNYGKSFGFFAASYASLNLLVVNYLLGDFSKLNFDVVVIVIFFWFAWLIGGFSDMERKIQRQLEQIAITDNLTGLPNYAYLQTTLDKWVNQARKENVPMSVAIMDLDDFKLLNDSLGHQKGDELLKNLAKIIIENVDDENIFFARYGGDEFSFLFYNYNLHDAAEKLNQIKRLIEDQLEIPYMEFLEKQLTLSLGIASFPQQAKNKRDLVDMADYALYQAKSTNKNQVRIYHKALSELAAEIDESDSEPLNSVRTLLSIIDAKDRYTYGHSERVAEYAEQFASKLNLSTEERKKLMFGAFLHDIGKIEIERSILMKLEKLSENEWNLIQKQPDIGAQILRPLKSCQDILPMILYHHENYDGSGYQNKLQGNNIPLFARILRIIDSYDAMTSERPYSSAKAKEEALEEIKRYSGKQFDPKLVNIFVRMIEEDIKKT